jgi:RNA polymerase sigma factor (sigma-70 family)
VNEAELVRRCTKGETKSQKKLFDLFSDRFFRLALRYLKDSAEAEDTVMVAFVRIFDNLKKFAYRDKGSLEAWMRKILVNEALMSLRRRHNFHLTETLDSKNPEHDPEVFQQTDATYLYELILELPDGYRTVFNLHDIEGYDHREIADLLGISESTSRSQLYKAKQLLKRRINHEGFHYGT